MLHVDETGSFAMSVYLVKRVGFNVVFFRSASSCQRRYAPAAAAVAVTTVSRSQRRLFAEDGEDGVVVVVEAYRLVRGETGRVNLLQVEQMNPVSLDDSKEEAFILSYCQ